MGCFFACFGFTNKRKRRKSSSKIISEDQSYGRYVPLDSAVSVKPEADEMPNPKSSATKLSEKPKESSISKVKKKVSFNLNVKTYEPLPNEDYDTYLSEGEEKTMWEFKEEERAGTSSLQFEEDSVASGFGPFPANYRYQNCRNSYDEEDEIESEESDLDLDDDSGSEDNDIQKLSSSESSIEAEERIENSAQLAEERKCKLDQIQAASSEADQEKTRMESNQSRRTRNQDAYSVLNPVENLTQWKTIKAKSRQLTKNQKENIVPENHSKPKKHGTAVDASLSNWLS